MFLSTFVNFLSFVKFKIDENVSVRPLSVTLKRLDMPLIEGIEYTMECAVNSVYKGQEVTEFRLNVGESSLASGTKSQTTGPVSRTYNVTYTHRQFHLHTGITRVNRCSVKSSGWMELV